MAALGGHSIEVEAPPGHFPLGKESLTQLAPLTHRTSATKDILNAGFLCQQSRRGGINLCTSKNSYKEGASHEIEIIVELRLPTRMDMNFLVIGSPMLCLQWVSGPTVIGMEKLV